MQNSNLTYLSTSRRADHFGNAENASMTKSTEASGACTNIRHRTTCCFYSTVLLFPQKRGFSRNKDEEFLQFFVLFYVGRYFIFVMLYRRSPSASLFSQGSEHRLKTLGLRNKLQGCFNAILYIEQQRPCKAVIAKHCHQVIDRCDQRPRCHGGIHAKPIQANRNRRAR